MSRAPKDPFVEFAVAIRQETAASLGIAGRRLQRALDALATCRREDDRDSLTREAADALWGYQVQKEILGLADDMTALKIFQIPTEVWQRAGALPKTLDLAPGAGRKLSRDD